MNRIYFFDGNKTVMNQVLPDESIGITSLSDQSKARRFQEIVLPHLHAAYNLARWLTRSDQDAEDVVQEAYMRAFKFFDSFRGGEGRTWLLAIVRNTTFTWLKENRDPGLTTPFDEALHSPGESEAAEGFEQPSNNPETILLKGEDRRLLNEALESLSLEFREVLVLRELEDLSYKEIANVTGIPIGTVMSRLARGRKMLAVCLRKP